MAKNELAEVRPFILMDKADEEQILQEMRGEIIKVYVYSYTDKGKTVEGLSKAGVDAAAMEMAARGKPIRVLDYKIDEDDRFYKAIVRVGRYIVKDNGTESLLDTTLGTKRQAKTYASGKENPFAFEQAVVKAERNAKRKLMPEKIIVEMMKAFKSQKGRMKQIEPENNGIEKVTPEDKSEKRLATKPQLVLLKKLKVDIQEGLLSFNEADKLIKETLAMKKEKSKAKEEPEVVPGKETIPEEEITEESMQKEPKKYDEKGLVGKMATSIVKKRLELIATEFPVEFNESLGEIGLDNTNGITEKGASMLWEHIQDEIINTLKWKNKVRPKFLAIGKDKI